MRNSPTKKPYANTPEHFRSSSRVHPAAPRSRPFRAISRGWTPFAALIWLTALAAVPALAQSAAPRSTAKPPAKPVRIDVTKIQPKSLLPKHAEHTEFVVEVNKLGQVSRIASERGSDNPTFNAQTYGNALQTFIRTPDGQVVLGTYRLTYDYDPKTTRVRRDVTLLHTGGVNPDAKGAATDLMDQAHTHPISPNIAPNPHSSVDPRSLPELKGVIEPTPVPAPASSP